MDKLKPILAHKFWIIFGFALLLPLIGWWLATAQLKAETDTRMTAIEGAFDSIPNPNEAPNEDWTKELKKVNATQQRRLIQSADYLWKKQKKLMVWPGVVERLMADVPFRAEISNRARNLYRTAYFDEVKRVRDIVEPYDETSGEGKVQVEWEAIPYVDPQAWAQLPPRSEVMWDSQEDIWLLTSIMQALRAVNRDAPAFAEAPLKAIKLIELMGGSPVDPAAKPATSSAEGMDAEAATGPPDSPAMPADDFQFGRGGGAGIGMNNAREIKLDFDPTVEFGDPVEAAEGSAEAAGSEAASPKAAEMPAGPGPGIPGLDMMGGGGRKQRRYIHDDEALPFKTRAFYIKVIIDQQHVPELVAQLSNMPWPVQIRRVHLMAANKETGLVTDNAPGMAAAEGGRRRMPRQPAGSGGLLGSKVPLPGAARLPGGRREETFPAGDGRGPEAGPDQAAKRIFEVSMADPYLAEVVVAGLMTLYQPPRHEAVADAEPQPKGEAEPEAAQAKSDVTSASQAGAQPATEAKPTAEPQPDSEAKIDAQATPKTKPDAEPKPEAPSETRPKAEAKPADAPKADAEAGSGKASEKKETPAQKAAEGQSN